jgi:multiple sugar transport system substrate-binding protein
MPAELHRSRILAVALVALAAGCSRGEPPPPAEGEPIVLVFKHQRMGGVPGTLEGLLREFEARHPGVRVVSEPLPNDTDLQHQFYVTNLEARTRSFDVLSLDVVWAPELARAGWLLDLSPWIAPEQVRAEFLPGSAEAVTWSERTWALPWFVDAGVLYWRADLLAKHSLAPPRTWAELLETARTVLEREKSPRLKGFVWQGRQYEGLVCAALEILRGFGGEVIGETGQLELQSTGTLAGLAFIRELMRSGISPPLTRSADEEAVRTIFANGEAVFMRNWPYAWTPLNAPGSPLRGLVGIGPVPSQSGEPGVGTLGGWNLGVNVNVPAWKRELAVELVLWLTGPEAQRAIHEGLGLRPPRLLLYQDAAYMEQDPFLSMLRPVLEQARPRPVTPYYLMLSQVLQAELSAVVSQLRTPEEAMERATQQMQIILGDRP